MQISTLRNHSRQRSEFFVALYDADMMTDFNPDELLLLRKLQSTSNPPVSQILGMLHMVALRLEAQEKSSRLALELNAGRSGRGLIDADDPRNKV